jgi:hypothetical protein
MLEDITPTSSPQEKPARRLASKRGPTYKGAFMSTVHFRQTLDRVARAKKQLQGRALDRQTLADIWTLKNKGGIVSETLRAAVDFGLFETDLEASTELYGLTDLGVSLIYTEADTPAWYKLAAEAVRHSQLHADMFDRYTLDATEAQLRLYFARSSFKAWKVDAFIPVFLRCAEIVRRAEEGDAPR